MGLSLQRKTGEVILIGDDIRITVTQALNGSCRLNVEAPRYVLVDREEIRERRIAGDWDNRNAE